MTAIIRWLDADGSDRSDGEQSVAPRGSMLLRCVAFLFVVQIVTGLLMMAVYSPSTGAAWGSVWYLQTQLPAGWFIRGVHLFASDAMIVLLVLALVRMLLARSLAKTAVEWWAALLALGLVLAISLSGELLPWDQHGYWGTTVRSNILARTPIIGPTIRALLLGGDAMGNLTLARFHALHVLVLPVMLAGLFWIARSMKRNGGRRADDRHRLRLAAARAILFLAVAALAWFAGRRLGSPMLDAPADPAAADYPARPEWHTLFLFQWLKYFEGPLAEVVAAILIPGAVLAMFLLFPVIARIAPGTRIRRAIRGFAGATGLAIVALTAIALVADRDPSESIVASIRERHRRGETLGPRDESLLRAYDFNRARAWADRAAGRAVRLAGLHGIPPTDPRRLLTDDPMTRGPELFAAHCASCHRFDGHDGKGRVPLDAPASSDLKGFATRDWIRGLLADPMSDRYFGRMKNPDGDPAHTRMAKWLAETRDGLTDDAQRKAFESDLDAAAAYLAFESLHPGDFGSERYQTTDMIPSEDRSLILRGRQVFMARCNECHSYDGSRTGTLMAPEMRGYGSLEWTSLMIAQPDHETLYRATGRERARMPAFRDRLSDVEITLIVKWLLIPNNEN